MKTLALSFTLAGAIALTGCSTLVSLNPFVTAQASVMDPAILGAWASVDGKDTYWIRQDGNGYTIRHANESGDVSYQFKARMMVTGDLKILDFAAAEESPFQIAVHAPVRVWVDGNTLRMVFLQSDWLKEQAKQKLPAAVVNDRLVLTAPGEAVAMFLTKYGGDPKAADDDAEVLRRIE